MQDNVHSPKHYTEGHVETIYAIEKALGPEGFRAYCIGNYIKYSSRHSLKNGEEDLKKASVYLDWAANGLPAPVNGMLPVKEGVSTAPEHYSRNDYDWPKAGDWVHRLGAGGKFTVTNVYRDLDLIELQSVGTGEIFRVTRNQFRKYVPTGVE